MAREWASAAIGRLSIVVLTVISSCWLILPHTASADITGTKKLIWEFRDPDLTGKTGSYSLTAKAYAKCSHDGDGWVTALPNPKTGTWVLLNGLNPAVDQEAVANAPHPTKGTAKASISAPAAVQTNIGQGGTPKWKITADIDLSGTKMATPLPPVDYARASYYAKGTARIRGQSIDGWELRGAVNGVALRPQIGRGTPSGAIGRNGESVHDPLAISVTEVQTGAVYTEHLFSLIIASESGEDCAVDWDYDWEAGVTMSVAKTTEGTFDGSVTIDGDSSSSWLVNPFGVFGASLSNGAFSATGAWAAAPWQLTYDGTDVIGAYLPAAYVPTIFDYVVPDALLNDSYRYDSEMSLDKEVEGWVEAEVVPEPTTAAFAMLLSVSIFNRRRG